MMKEKGFMINHKTFKKVKTGEYYLIILLQVVHAVDRKRPWANHLYPVCLEYIFVSFSDYLGARAVCRRYRTGDF